MGRLLSLGMSLVFSVGSMWASVAMGAESAPLSSGDAGWTRVIDRIAAEGQPLETPAGTFYVLKDVTASDASGSNVVSYLSAVGAMVDGTLHIERFEAVLEKWTRLENGGWEIQQWQFSVDQTGKLVEPRRQVLVKDRNEAITASKSLQVSFEDGLVEWEAVKSFWIHRRAH